MQISRHWRLNSQRYRLEGFRTTNGEVSLQARSFVMDETREQTPQTEPVVARPHAVAVTSSAA